MNGRRDADQGLTPDEPYVPHFDNPEDAQEAMRATRPDGHAPEHAPRDWQPPQGRINRSLLPEPEQDLVLCVRDALDKLEGGEPLSPEKLQQLAVRGALRALQSRRPAAVANAARLLANLAQPVRAAPHGNSIAASVPGLRLHLPE